MFNPAPNAMNLRFALLPFLFAPIVSQAAVVMFAEYRLGETGSLGSDNLPQDTSGNGLNFSNSIGGANAGVGTVGAPSFAGAGGVAGTSTAYVDTSAATGEGWYSNGLFSALPSDNFAFGIFAQASSTSNQGWVFGLAGTDGALSIELTSGGWRASRRNQSWIGDTGAFTADQWVHLAVVRSGGSTGFYINGALVGATDSGAPSAAGDAHLAVMPGGNYFFNGKLDEARVVTFSAGESTANVIAALQTGVSAVPEPSAYGLLGAGALAGAALVRRRRR